MAILINSLVLEINYVIIYFRPETWWALQYLKMEILESDACVSLNVHQCTDYSSQESRDLKAFLPQMFTHRTFNAFSETQASSNFSKNIPSVLIIFHSIMFLLCSIFIFFFFSFLTGKHLQFQGRPKGVACAESFIWISQCDEFKQMMEFFCISHYLWSHWPRKTRRARHSSLSR